MSIATTDVKLLKSQRLTDEADGGGRATGTAVVDGEVNNVFPDLSRLDRTVGRINLRKLFAGVMTTNDDAYLGAHAIVTDGPADPRVSVLLFNTGSQTDQRSNARDAIESYVAAASAAAFELLGTQLSGQRAIACVQREEQRVPEVGEVYQLAGVNGTQYVRLMAVEQRLEQFTYEYTPGNFQNFIRRRLDLSLSGPLLFTFPGGQVTPAGTTSASLDGLTKTRVLSTQVADAARYYGISKLAQACAVGDLSLRVASVYSQLVPSTTKESALVDLLAGYQRQVYLPAGPARNVNITVAAGAVAGESRTFLGTGCAPGTLTVTVNGGTFSDDRKGALRFVSGSNWISSARVDYQTGEITLVRTGTSFTGTGTASYQPGAAATGDTITGEVEVTLGNRGFTYTLNLAGAIPRRGTLSVSFMALGKWYELRDYGDGLLTGEGAGTISLSTGSVSLTLNALPDVGSSLVYSYISSADNTVTQRTGSSVVPSLEVRFTLPHKGIRPTSLTVTYLAGSTTKTLTDNGNGALSGTGGTGTIAYASGELVMVLSTTPSAGLSYSYEQGTVTGSVLTVTSDTSGYASFTIPGAPLKPGSVRAQWATTRRQAAPALNWDAVESGNALPVFDGLVDVSKAAADNGSGGWQGGFAGTINYSTGACTLQVAALYNYNEHTYTNRKKQMVNGSVTEPLLVTTPVSTRESFGGTLSVDAQAAGVAVVPQSATQAQPPLTVDLLPGVGEAIVPGSLLFTWNGATYCDRSGIIYRDIASNTNGGTAVGTVDYASARVTLNSYAGNVASAVTVLACLTASVGFSVTALTFRTPGAPLRSGSLQLTVVRTDTAQVVTATADANGLIDDGIVQGTVDIATGIARVVFTTDLDDETGASDVPVIPLLARYNAVVQTQLPLDAGLLGLDPVRLPADGRVPIYREGGVLVIHHTAETVVASPAPGGTVPLARQQQASITVVDANGVALRAASYSVDREAGSVTWANPVVLQAEDGSPLTLPLKIRDRVEHMTMCSEVQITGEIGLSAPMPWDLPAEETKVSSAVTWGDLQSRIHTWFTQQTWSTGAPNWTDVPVGNTTTAQYNSLSYPPVITNKGAIDGKWALVFTSGTAYQVVEEKLGVITTGNITSDCAPINPLTGEPYFLIKKEGWGSGWAAANAVRFNTDAALGPLWVIRTVISGQGTVDDDQFKLQIRGDAD
ncbi:hypothetical protein [Aquipseudomonas alcaligenes]|uniref:Uncharacterized protein n=1 Tax=Aquipseudomonas alcaligenes (strain ATCC 14909 / DSM 50342 / CCUG 1425 / JCM 20561 / NBRC 14159 / NCIMB 9945 / NCTC 10367 / 1577) TaxID=1215092 RepID=U2ZNK2_AQUA1|nr:hypothetical protein [Pseudomonas alcaligenes]GAD62642.1 hypothetical protein PA6_014_00150 [Pseudomonas alcaligenes NBRC 14159]SUD18179.1 Uncharacterised protein [Pseudomonas alcaligenes]